MHQLPGANQRGGIISATNQLIISHNETFSLDLIERFELMTKKNKGNVKTTTLFIYPLTEAELLEVTGTKFLRVFLLTIHSHLY